MALEGIRVVDLTVVGAGPIATRLLGQLGAEILKIELPDTGDLRRRGTKPPGVPEDAQENPVFEDTNLNKKSVTIDLHTEKGQEILHQLVAKSDIFTSNLLPEALVRFKADYETLVQYNPRLVYARGSVFGPNGPDANTHGAARDGAAISGMMTLNSYFETTGEPIPAIGTAADTLHALAMAYGILAALIARDRLGIGQEVTLSQLGACMNILLGSEMMRELGWGMHVRYLSRDQSPALSSWYKCKDGKWIMLKQSLREDIDGWYRICAALGKPELANDPRFKDKQSQGENNELLIKILDDVFLTKTRLEWDTHLRQVGIEFCRINELSDLTSDPQVLANNYIWEVEHPKYGRIKVLGHPVTFTKTPATLRSFAPEVGQHTEIILTELLGYGHDEIVKLKNEGVI
jgi:crotonobetainyl-CoA:carnitine CoA-transferase CaiB-like acyl-CoA transferase